MEIEQEQQISILDKYEDMTIYGDTLKDPYHRDSWSGYTLHAFLENLKAEDDAFDEEGKCGFIDKSGNVVIPCQWEKFGPCWG